MQVKLSDGEIIYYRDIGKGFPLVFLHGNNLDGNYFAKQAELYRNFRLIFIDSRNHGRSSRKRMTMSFEQMAEDLEEVLTHLSIEKAVFVGHSDGANLAMVYAGLYPKRVMGLLLNAGNMTFKGLTLWSRVTVYVQYGFLKVLSPLSAQVDHLAQISYLMLGDLPLKKDILAQATYPAWVVMGQHDVIGVHHSRAIAELFPHHKLYVERRQGHRLAQRKSKVFNQIIRDLVGVARKEVVL